MQFVNVVFITYASWNLKQSSVSFSVSYRPCGVVQFGSCRMRCEIEVERRYGADMLHLHYNGNFTSSLPGVKGLAREADHVRSRRRRRMSGAVPTLPPYVLMSCRGTALILFCAVTWLGVSVRISNVIRQIFVDAENDMRKFTEKKRCT
jgi:hypothetical protein